MEFVFDLKLEFYFRDGNVEVVSIPTGLPESFT
jgi:hypothetical protein